MLFDGDLLLDMEMAIYEDLMVIVVDFSNSLRFVLHPIYQCAAPAQRPKKNSVQRGRRHNHNFIGSYTGVPILAGLAAVVLRDDKSCHNIRTTLIVSKSNS